MVAPRAWRASMREDPVAGDPFYRSAGQPGIRVSRLLGVRRRHRAGRLSPAAAIRGLRLAGRDGHRRARQIVLVRYSVPYSYRGFKALTAEQRGAAGILIYSDPADDGSQEGESIRTARGGPTSHIQRGGIVYDFLVPGDPLTPGWASMPARRASRAADAVSLPAIISAPLSWKDARVMLESIGGPEAPAAWRGGLPLTYRLGGGPLVVRLRVRTDDRVRPIWTVTGLIRGSERPDQLVIVGNHRDAWIYGGVDPSSGTAALMELARTLGELARRRLAAEAHRSCSRAGTPRNSR